MEEATALRAWHQTARSKGRFVFWVVALVIASWRLSGIESRSLWFDEAFSWRLTRFSWSEMFERAARDVHPPLYYMILKIWTGIAGDSVVSMRLVSLGWFCAALGAAVLLCREAVFHPNGESMDSHLKPTSGERESSLIAVLLLASSPFLHRYSQEVRMYTQAVALAIAATYLLLRALRAHSGSPKWWIAYSLVAVALAYTHYFGLFTLASHATFVSAWLPLNTQPRDLLPWRNSTVAGALGAALLASVIYLPWVPTLLDQQAQVKKDYWASDIEKSSPLSGQLWQSIIYRSIVMDKADQFSVTIAISDSPPWLVNLVVIGFLVVLAGLARRNDRVGWCLLAVIILPADFAILLSFSTGRSLIEQRFLMASFALWMVGLALVLGRIPNDWFRWSVTTAVIAGLLVATSRYRASLNLPAHSESRRAVEAVAAELTSDDTVVSASPSEFFSLAYHGREHFGVRQARSNVVGIRHYNGGPIFQESDFVDWSVISSKQDGRIWLIGFRGDLDSLVKPERWKLLKQTAFPESIQWLGDVVVELWDIPPNKNYGVDP